MGLWTTLAILVLASFVPPLLYLLWIRNLEVHSREPLSAVLRAFIFGGSAGVLLALLLHVIFDVGLTVPTGGLGFDEVFMGAVVVAPFAEELAKGLGLGGARKNIRRLQDGIIYGAALGLGFAATENLVYAYAALADGGTQVALGTLLVRSFSSMLLHAAASSLLGFGYGIIVLRSGVIFQLLPYYLVAVFLHGAFNFLILWSEQSIWGFLVAVAVVFSVSSILRHQVQVLDALPHERST